ncbi:MAG: outer membrane beta-barrel protein [Myxococcota bacterium]|nr:hypothetical protein [Deltaproteobacteria bacterium]
MLRVNGAAFLAVVGLLAMPFGSATAEESGDKGILDGAYARLGLAIGWPNIDDSSVSGSTGAGLSFVGGYEVMNGLAAEVEFVFTAGTQAERADGTEFGESASNIAFTINAKAYPLELLGQDLLPEKIRPYGIFGMGGGSVGAGGSEPGIKTIGAFLVRFGGGVDWMFTSNFGLYADGSYYVSSKDVRTGYGNMTFGAIYAF